MAKGFNFTAFSWRDVRDARRGRPKGDLEGYARERGLEYLRERPPQGFEHVLPRVEGQVFNVVAGDLPGGPGGVLYHERLRIPAAGGKPPQGSSWWGTYYSSGPLRPDLGDLLDPLDLTHELVDALDPTDLASGDLSDVLGGGRAGERDDAFMVPCTAAATRIPGAHIPAFRLDRRPRVPPHGYDHARKLDGLRGWQLQTREEAAADTLAPLVSGPLADVLRDAHKPFFQIVAAGDTVLVRRNGFAKDPGDLDALSAALGKVTAAVPRG